MKLKKILSLIICMSFVPMTGAVSFAAEIPTARLYNVYGDNMLFKQNDDAVFAGVGNSGNTVSVKLFNSKSELVCSSQTVVKNDGTFEVSFVAPEGGYEEYTVILYDNSVEFEKLEGVVFGEMWLASGQSNMEYMLSEDATIDEVRQNGYGSEWVRALLVGQNILADDDPGQYIPETLDDTPEESKWVKANSSEIETVSAIGYFFAQKLQKELDMPVGIINANRGATPICNWISRQRLENDPTTLAILKEHNEYFSLEQYYNATDEQKAENTAAKNLSSSYNEQIYPVRHFRLSGMLWYQGEDNLGNNYSRGQYSHLFDLLQDEMSETFSFGGDLPVILSDLAVYGPYPKNVQLFNDEFASMVQLKPESRAVVTNYDIFPSFNSDNHGIHPNQKKPVGERMEIAGMSLVYGENRISSAPYVEKTSVEGDKVYVTLSNSGDGLVKKGDKLYDFAVCGEDGVYFKAEAEIVSKDTVMISSSEVKNPVAATYAISSVNLRANLYATLNGELVMPVSPFVTDIEKSKTYYCDSPYFDMEQSELWEPLGGKGMFVPIWKTHDCTYTLSPDSAFEGQNGMSLEASSDTFAIYRQFKINKYFMYENSNYNWTGYKSLKVRVRNNGEKDVKIQDLRLGTSDKKVWYAPTVNGTPFFSAVIPADGQWHTVEYDLTNLYRNEIILFKYDNSELSKVFDLQFNFKSSSDSSRLDIDALEFGSSVESGQSKRPVSFVVRAYRFVNSVLAKIGDIFNSIFGR